MSPTPAVGPYRQLRTDDGGSVPFYMLRFDKCGLPASPRTTAHAIEELARGGYTDVFLFSHGWNNDWAAATNRYDSFIDGFRRTRGAPHGVELKRPYRPLLIGVFWPSAILVFPGERAPVIAAAPGPPGRADEAEDLRAVEALADELPAADKEEFYELIEADRLEEPEAQRLAELLAPLHQGADEDWGEPGAAPTPDDLLATWRQLPPEEPAAEDDLDDFGTADAGASGPKTAGGFSLDPRGLVRATTVRMMKDRAGAVGVHGMNPLIRAILKASKARLHLIGHSYGCRVCLSAVAAGGLPRPVNSMLLLQPAVNHLCFADTIALTGQPGGYHHVPDHVEQPVIATFSRHDKPLVRFFHLALTRDSDLGEPQVAAWPEPPSVYAALGGYGPRSTSGSEVVEIKHPGTRYGLSGNATRVLAVDGSDHIGGHSDISNEHTWWALYDQVATDEREA